MNELIFLVIPIAVLYGWYMGIRSVRQNNKKNITYVQGLNFLLSHNTDKAVDKFIEVLTVDEDTFETHISLGFLYRKRGEIDKAIKIHENIISRYNVTLEQKKQALFELGIDFLLAGIYDRAENIFLQLLEDPLHSSDVEYYLLEIYQIIQEWDKGISIYQRFSSKMKKETSYIIAHFYCELSTGFEKINIKKKYLRQALKMNITCSRARIELIKLYVDNNKLQKANDLFDLLCQDTPFFSLEMLDFMVQCNTRIEYLSKLENLLHQTSHDSVVIKMTQLYIEDNQFERAEKLLIDYLSHRASIGCFKQLLWLKKQLLTQKETFDCLSMFEDLIHHKLYDKEKYCCQNCGFKTQIFYWHCPSCKKWESIIQ